MAGRDTTRRKGGCRPSAASGVAQLIALAVTGSNSERCSDMQGVTDCCRPITEAALGPTDRPKADVQPLTEADYRSQAHLAEGLSRLVIGSRQESE